MHVRLSVRPHRSVVDHDAIMLITGGSPADGGKHVMLKSFVDVGRNQ